MISGLTKTVLLITVAADWPVSRLNEVIAAWGWAGGFSFTGFFLHPVQIIEPMTLKKSNILTIGFMAYNAGSISFNGMRMPRGR